jgi:hypothetical protein
MNYIKNVFDFFWRAPYEFVLSFVFNKHSSSQYSFGPLNGIAFAFIALGLFQALLLAILISIIYGPACMAFSILFWLVYSSIFVLYA